ncbi:MAG TPA: SDR family oxidoreductase [Caulobacterales bacterium]|nr:SDR family oxidoreductase [Caulobacterales bacterium]
MQDFDGKIVLVTGGGTGLGAALAIGAAARGAKSVIINYRTSAAEAEATAETVRAAGAEAVLARGDVSKDEDCRAIVAHAERFGRIDALANNSGTTKFAPAHGDLDALSADDFLRLYAVNVVGPFQMIRAARSLLETSDRSAVLMISSIAGVTGIGSSVAYAASKGALNTMTLSLARVLGPKIRVNALCPGFIDTRWHEGGYGAEGAARLKEMVRNSTPLQAASTPEDIADAGLFFLSDASRHVTGETLLVDAGTHLGYATFAQR